MIGSICIPTKGKVYYVLPYPENMSSCQHGQLCHTLDYLAEHSDEFFSSDHVNVTLIFMRGIHNYTKKMTLQNLQSLVMKGATESREKVILDHHQIDNGTNYCTLIQFVNITSVNITNLTMRCPALNIVESHIAVRSSNLYGYHGTNKSLSFIHITGQGSQALLDNITFKENCFIESNFSAGIIVSSSTFQSYKCEYNSIITSNSSVVTLMGKVNFTDSNMRVNHQNLHYAGMVVFLQTTHSDVRSSLNITAGAIVYIRNIKGRAVYGENAAINIDAKAQVAFMNNGVLNWGSGGAVYLTNGQISIGTGSNVIFAYNQAQHGGAIFLINGTLNIDSNASLTFSHNVVKDDGGAVYLENGELVVNTNAKMNFTYNSAHLGGAVYLHISTICIDAGAMHFYHNSGSLGGGIYFVYGAMHINTNKSVTFVNNTAQSQGGAIYLESSVNSSIVASNSSKLLFFNNSAFRGGALYIIPSSFTITVEYQSSIQFVNNTASDIGGAVYAEMQPAAPCLFMVTDYSAEISFIGNYANHHIGHHMYGTSVRADKCGREHIQLVNKQGKPYCSQINTHDKPINISFTHPCLNETPSPISSAPQRVCLCDSHGKPQCTKYSFIFPTVSIYRGELFTLSVSIVGYDFGATVGTVNAGFLNDSNSLLGQSQAHQRVDSSETCTKLEYTVLTKFNREILVLQTSVLPVSVYVSNEGARKNYLYHCRYFILRNIQEYVSNHNQGCFSDALIAAPIFVIISLLPGCPPGFILSRDRTTCSCFPVLLSNDFKCSIQNKRGILQWNSAVWVNASFNESHSTGVIYNRFCPLLYCKSGNKTINIGDDPNKQCASNRTGILCGACMDNFSLAIGSSRCIECPNSHNVALLLAFAAAGVLLVLSILVLNLTVTQGLINGLIFYSNIVWAYKIILFPSEVEKNNFFTLLQVFIAWLNLDFGIETCFFVGLDAYWKTWLQFLFPIYIWAIAGVIIVACRYSIRLTNLIGSRAVPLLATLFLLSYMKLLRTVTDATSVAVIAQYPQNTSYAVWYLDGNLRYCQHPHIYLFITATATLVFLWLPYTLLLLFIQPLRRVSHLRPLKWINKLAPVYDAYFSPLKDKHRYWFGTLLLVRGILLVLLTVTSVAHLELNVLILLLFITSLLFFISIKNVYKRMTVRLLESATLLNLIVLSAGTLYLWESAMWRMIFLEASIGITFAQFCVIVVWSLVKLCLSAGWRCRRNNGYDVIDENIDNDIVHERIEDPEIQPLINYIP